MKNNKPTTKVKTKKQELAERNEAARQERLEIMRQYNISNVELPYALQKIVDDEGDANDLEKLGDTKDLYFQIMMDRATGMVWRSILDKYRCRWNVVGSARVRSKTFRKLMNAVEEIVKDMRIADTEDRLYQMANGEVPIKKGYIPPDVKAADLYLRGNDSRYSNDKNQQATQVVINLGGGLEKLPSLN